MAEPVNQLKPSTTVIEHIHIGFYVHLGHIKILKVDPICSHANFNQNEFQDKYIHLSTLVLNQFKVHNQMPRQVLSYPLARDSDINEDLIIKKLFTVQLNSFSITVTCIMLMQISCIIPFEAHWK